MSYAKKWLDDPVFQDLKTPLVAIVRFNSDRRLGSPLPQNPAVHFQISIHPEKFTQSGVFFRADSTQGDEIHGWQRAELIFVEEILGELQDDKKTVLVPDARGHAYDDGCGCGACSQDRAERDAGGPDRTRLAA